MKENKQHFQPFCKTACLYTPSPVNLPVSKYYAQLPSPIVAAETVTFSTKVRTFWLSFLAVFDNCHHSSSAAITLKYGVKNIRNDVSQIINLNSTQQCGASSPSPQ